MKAVQLVLVAWLLAPTLQAQENRGYYRYPATQGDTVVLTGGGDLWQVSVTAAESGVYDDGKWLIEGHGVDPDITVDNLPNATFTGKDAQLDAAVAYLKQLIAEKPLPVPKPPPYPDKRFPQVNRGSSQLR